MKIWNAVLAGLRWVWSYFVWAWNWLEDKHYDPPPVSLKRMFYGVLVTVGFGVWIGYALFHSVPQKPREIVKLVEVPVQLAPGPLPVAVDPLPCVPTPDVKVLNPVKKATHRKSRTVRKPVEPKEAVYTIDWGF